MPLASVSCNTGLAGTAPRRHRLPAPVEVDVKTPWLELDDVFYEARGHTWALLHLLHAIDHDFKDVLEKKNARVSLQQIIRELEPTQQPICSPMILNGDGFGLVANHSLVMASYISRANAAIIDLRNLLRTGLTSPTSHPRLLCPRFCCRIAAFVRVRRERTAALPARSCSAVHP